jgi:predicted NAD-dependent protein-ADP-ribosyltransferase YbiA (DUF1768 family)
MKEILLNYYAANPVFLEKLIKTKGKRLSHYENTKGRSVPYWGETNSDGENNHGKILMELREELE